MEHLIRNLRLLVQQEKMNRNMFKAKAYNTVLLQLQALPADTPVHSVDDLIKDNDIKGIGKSIRSKIEEILATGKTTAVDTKKIEAIEAVETLGKIMAIGPVKAKELVEKHGIYTVEQLEREGVHLLNDKQKMGLKYHADFELRIPRAEMEKHEAFLRSVFGEFAQESASDANILTMEIAGSYRRGVSSSGDIDVLITGPKNVLQPMVTRLQQKKYLIDIFGHGDKKCIGVCKLPRHKHARRIDIMYTAPEQFPFALLYFTGSQKFNIQMRQRALEMGYSLNEYGLTPTADARTDALKKLPETGFKTEADVFEFLEMPFRSPRERQM